MNNDSVNINDNNIINNDNVNINDNNMGQEENTSKAKLKYSLVNFSYSDDGEGEGEGENSVDENIEENGIIPNKSVSKDN